jgi:DNA-binding XRE family transcriptional regulator
MTASSATTQALDLTVAQLTKVAKEAKPRSRSAVADRFVALRREMGLSQSRLGRYIGLCRQSVSEVENCRVTPHDSTWDRFCDYEREGQESGIEHLPKHYWRNCLIEEQAQKGDTFCASR